MEYVNVVGVQFRRAGRIYDFSTEELNLHVGDDVVVETDRGPSLAKVAIVRYKDMNDYKEHGLKKILRSATDRDMEEAMKLTPEFVVNYARKTVDELELKMSVLQSEVQFGGNKAIIFFTAPGRVDFRQLVKDLASGLKARVELKQVGARDEAKLVGGVGICGREFCCSSFLREFVPVSIKMAKNQNLALNPTKVSGGCGRLLCCLTYENDIYTELRKELPKKGTNVRILETGVEGKVLKGDALNQKILVDPGNGERWVECFLKDMEILDGSKATPKSSTSNDTDAQASQVAAKATTKPTTAIDDDWGDDIDMDGLIETMPASKSAAQQNPNDKVTPKTETAKASPHDSGSSDKPVKSKNKSRNRNRNKPAQKTKSTKKE